MEGQELKAGKERVSDLLIKPLVKRGLVRKRSHSEAHHLDFLESLQARLAYMAADRLAALAEVIECHAEGARKNVWPSEVSIMNWARRLQIPPSSESRLVRSYLQSAAGRAARDQGYLVELFFHLRKFGAPPNDYSLGQIRDQADFNKRRFDAVRRDIEDDRASPREIEELRRYLDAKRRCLDITNATTEGAAA